MPGDKKKVLVCLYKAGDAAKNPDFEGCAENALGLREMLEKDGHTIIVTDNKEPEGDSEVDKHLPDTNILVTTPFHPVYMTRSRFEKAEKLELVITAGIGSDHLDLNAAADKGITVSEVTGSNVVSVAEDIVMRILILMRNFLPAYHQIINGDWNVAQCAVKAYDLEGKTIGTVGGGRIGYETMKRLKLWNCKLLYYARHEKPDMGEVGVEFIQDMDEMLAQCDIITINIPLSDKTRGMFNKKIIGKMKKGAYLINTARGAICDCDAVVEACESGQLGGYAGDVWDRQPAPKDHPWRTMPNHAMTPHLSGTTLDAQKRYAQGTREMVQQWIDGKPFNEDNYIVREGQKAEQYT